MILITHYMDEAVRADKVFVIDDGDLVMQGTPKESFLTGGNFAEIRSGRAAGDRSGLFAAKGRR